jgi:hypothetical protein
LSKNLHVVYRADELATGRQWSCYSFPESIYAGGPDLPGLRKEFKELAISTLGPAAFKRRNLIEHEERAMYRGVYGRVAHDAHLKERTDLIKNFSVTMVSGDQAMPHRLELARVLPVSASGDRIVIACRPDDTIRWVLEQTGPQDAVAVCMTGPTFPSAGIFLPWTTLLREEVELDAEARAGVESLADAGLGLDSTISNLIMADIRAATRRRMLVRS